MAHFINWCSTISMVFLDTLLLLAQNQAVSLFIPGVEMKTWWQVTSGFSFKLWNNRILVYENIMSFCQEPQSGTETVSLRIRADPWYGTIFLFLKQIAPSWRLISALVHARVVGSCVNVVTLRDQMLRVPRFSCGSFRAMAENKETGLFYELLCP